MPSNVNAQGVPVAKLARPCPPLCRGRKLLRTSLQDAHLPRYHHSALQHLILHVHLRHRSARQTLFCQSRLQVEYARVRLFNLLEMGWESASYMHQPGHAWHAHLLAVPENITGNKIRVCIVCGELPKNPKRPTHSPQERPRSLQRPPRAPKRPPRDTPEAPELTPESPQQPTTPRGDLQTAQNPLGHW